MAAGGTISIDPLKRDDLGYRYKMSPLITKVEGRGNGIKTVVLNIAEVAKQCKTAPEWLTRFFGIEKGALSRYDVKRGAGVAIINGVHTSADLAVSLDKYITEFVLCPKCRLVELQVKVSSVKSLLGVKCHACGYQGANKSLHKIKQYMISHPPKYDLGGFSDSSKKKGKKAKKKKGSSLKSASTPAIAEDGWSVSIDDEAVRERKVASLKSLRGSAKKVSSKDLAMITDRDSPVGVLRVFMLTGQRSVSELFDELLRIQMAHAMDETARMKVTMEALLDPTSVERFNRTLADNGDLFRLLISEEGSASRFFSCLEEVICRRNYGQLLPKANPILLSLYKEKVVTALDICQWWDTPADSAWLVEKEEAQRLRDAAQTMADFCRELVDNDEESDSSSDDESEYEDDESEESGDTDETKDDSA